MSRLTTADVNEHFEDYAKEEERRMAITSKPIAPKQSAIVSRAQLARSRGAIEKILAYGVLFLSFLGTVVAFHGGWARILSLQISLGAIAAGLLAQLVLTFLQWAYKYNRPLCWGSRLVDAGLTAGGYGPIFVPIFLALLLGLGLNAEQAVTLPWLGQAPIARVGAWGIMGLVSLLAAWYPEDRLVD